MTGAATPGAGKRLRLAVLLHDTDGRLVGGLIGRTFWDWLVIELLWVERSARGTGHGRRLVAMAEDEARRRGCHHARVDTYSFQAPGFYEKCGYARFAALDGFRAVTSASPTPDRSPEPPGSPS